MGAVKSPMAQTHDRAGTSRIAKRNNFKEHTRFYRNSRFWDQVHNTVNCSTIKVFRTFPLVVDNEMRSDMSFPSIKTARGIIPLFTNSRNFVLPIPKYAAASSARNPRGFMNWFGFCTRISVSKNKKTSAESDASRRFVW